MKKVDDFIENKVHKEIVKLLDYIEVDNNDYESIEEIIMILKADDKNTYEVIQGIHKTAIDKVNMFNLIAICCYEREMWDMIIPFLDEAYKLDSQDLDTNYNLAYILMLLGENELAQSYLSKLRQTNPMIESLKVELKDKVNM